VDAIELLCNDHQTVRRILTELEDKPVTYPSPDQVRERQHLVTELMIAESRHEAVEEQYFWPIVRAALPDGDELADEAIRQESEAQQLLDDVNKARADQPDFESMIRRVIVDLRDHIDYEEIQVWPRVISTVDKERLVALGEKMIRAKEKVPSRPHPKAPATSAPLETTGKAAMAAHRDKLTGRGR
jgi:hemerythrin-like domain-containing protein